MTSLSPTSPSKVAVFWDIINNFPLQSSHSSSTIIQKIQHLARAQGSLASFRAYAGGFTELPAESQSELRRTLTKDGVSLTTYSRPEPINIERLISVDVFAHALDTPHATMILVAANPSAFFYSISALRNRGFPVVLIVPPNDTGTSVDRADLVLGWDEVLSGDWEADALKKEEEMGRIESGAREEEAGSPGGRRGSEESRDEQPRATSGASSFAVYERANGHVSSSSSGSSVLRTQAEGSPVLASEESLRSHERESAMQEGNAFGITGLQQALTAAWPQEAASLHALNADSLPAVLPRIDDEDEWESAARPEHESSWTSHMPGAARSTDTWPSSPPELRSTHQQSSDVWSTSPSEFRGTHKDSWGFDLMTSLQPSLALPSLPSSSLPASPPPPPLGGSYASTLVPKPNQYLRGGITPSGAHDPSNALPPSSSIRRTRAIPRAFVPLVEVLRERLAQGETRPARGLIGTDLKEGNPAIYLLGPGLMDFKSYTAAAQRIGIVKLGRADFQGGEWIQLMDAYRA